MSSNVSRRSFFRIATGSIVSIPSIAGATAATIVSVPRTALADEAETANEDTLFTNEVELIPLTRSEVAFVVCDMSVADPAANHVSGAYVKITSTYTKAFVEGYTDANGSILFDIKGLAIRDEGQSADDLESYNFVGSIEVTCDGYRDFLTGQMIIEGMQTHVIPTRKKEKDWPYPARVSLDGWDVLYTDNTPTLSPKNDLVHNLEVALKDVAPGVALTLSLAEANGGAVLHTVSGNPTGTEFVGGFNYKYLLKDGPNALKPDRGYCMRIEQGGTRWEFPLQMQAHEVGLGDSFADEPSKAQSVKLMKPFGSPQGQTTGKLSKAIPIGGGLDISSWVPDFGPVHVDINPWGYVMISLTIGEMEYPWGKSREWASSPDRQTETSYSGKQSITTPGDAPYSETTKNEGWKWFPRKTLADQWGKQREMISKNWNNYQMALNAKEAGSHNRNISFSSVLKINVKAVAFAILRWNLWPIGDDKPDPDADPGFSGDVGLSLIASASYTYCNNFLAGPVPVLFQFGFNFSTVVTVAIGVMCGDPDKDRKKKLEAGQAVTPWTDILTNLDYYNWDFTNSGFTITITFCPWISIGVGVKGVASVSLRGSVTLTYLVNVPFVKTGLTDNAGSIADKPTPHMIWGVSADIDLVFEIFFFSFKLSVVKIWNDHLFNNWNDPAWQGDDWKAGGGDLSGQTQTWLGVMADEGADVWSATMGGYSSEQIDEMLRQMTPITDEVMRLTAEGESNGLATQSEEGAAPALVMTATYVGDYGVTDEGVVIPAVVYTYGVRDEQAALPADVPLAVQDEQAVSEGAEAALFERAEPAPEEVEQAEAAPEDGVATSDNPYSYAMSSYDLYWESPIGGLQAMEDGHPVAGIGVEGGVRLADAMDARLNPEGSPVFGSQRGKVVQLADGTVLSLRIGTVLVGGNPRTRIIATKIAGDDNIGLKRVIDFDILKPEVAGDSGTDLADKLQEYNRADLYDYEFAATVAEASPLDMEEYLLLAVLSGRRKLDEGSSNAEKLALAATDLVLTWVRVRLRYPFVRLTDQPLQVESFSWPGSMVFADDMPYHSISNLQIGFDRTEEAGTEGRLSDEEIGTTFIAYLDRSGATPEDALSHVDGRARIRMGVVFVARYVTWSSIIIGGSRQQWVKYATIVNDPAAIEQAMGRIEDGSTHELRLWNRANGRYVYMVRGAHSSRYYVMQVDPGDLAMFLATELLSPHIKSIRPAGSDDGFMRLHHWRDESGVQRFLCTKAGDSASSGDGGDAGVARELCQVSFNEPDGEAPSMSFESIGPKDFSISSFGAVGDFIYWPGTKDGVPGHDVEISGDDVALKEQEAVTRSWLLGARYRVDAVTGVGKFSEPFFLADLGHKVDHVVSIRGTDNALDVVSCGIVDHDNMAADYYHTRIPFVRCITATEAMAEMPYVAAGRDATFYLTLRNDGNTFIRACTIEMWCDGAAASSAKVEFSAETTTVSTYNPAVEGSATGALEGVEPDYMLAPGKTSVYKVVMPIPADWVGGLDAQGNHLKKLVKFRACSPLSAKTAGLDTQAEGDVAEEGIEYSVSEAEVPMKEIGLVVYHHDELAFYDAPLTMTTSDSSASGGSEQAPAGSAQRSGGKSKTRLPETGDYGRGLGVGSAVAAALGTAVLAYERRRAANESDDE